LHFSIFFFLPLATGALKEEKVGNAKLGAVKTLEGALFVDAEIDGGINPTAGVKPTEAGGVNPIDGVETIYKNKANKRQKKVKINK
jgi:hypothetical protein